VPFSLRIPEVRDSSLTGQFQASAVQMLSLAYIALSWAFLATFRIGADGAVLVTSSTDSGHDADPAQQSRLVRREPDHSGQVERSLAERPFTTVDEQLSRAKQKLEELGDQKATTEVKMQKFITDLRIQDESYEKQRMDAEARVHKLEAEKRQEMQEKKEMRELISSEPAPKSAIPKKQEMVAESAKQRAIAAERRKSESLQRAFANRAGVGVKSGEGEKSEGKDRSKVSEKTQKTIAERKKEIHKATVSGLPEIAFASDAWIVEDKEQHFANLMRIISERQNQAGGSDDSLGDEYCDKDYPLGQWNTSDCSSDGATDHKLIESEALCLQAAKQANATAGDGAERYFRIPDEWGDLHPKGCFVFPCHWDPGHVCYWFNPQEDTPLYPWGAPVCERPLFRNGTADTNSGCPDGYDVIMNENNCTEAGYCNSYCVPENFLVGTSYPDHNMSQKDIYPEGCFIHEEQGCVYFNEPYGPHPPQNPKGIPLCNVTQITHFPEIELPFDIWW